MKDPLSKFKFQDGRNRLKCHALFLAIFGTLRTTLESILRGETIRLNFL
jgi:hypothetical protein